jgi:hypothetical protein
MDSAVLLQDAPFHFRNSSTAGVLAKISAGSRSRIRGLGMILKLLWRDRSGLWPQSTGERA